jgi:RNA polymerase sigma-70 factor (ECF subfamily)
MRKIAEGDERAFRQLVRRHLSSTVRLAQRILGGAAAEDVAQEAFIRVWKHAGNFEDPVARGAKFSTWLYRIVINLCIDEKRKGRFAGALDDIPEPVDHTPNAEQGLQRREQSNRVRAALDALPERQRTAFVLCFYEERSNKEAADMMGVGLKALESLLVRARKTLRAQLEEERNGK